MNTQEEIQQAYVDYHRTHFGGWPWKKDDVVFSKKEGRFVKYANGTIERRALFPELKNKRSSS